jgi:hypothetical protein
MLTPHYRKHVLFDLQPYACTYPECQLHEYFFESREDWFNHESQSHRLEWFCNTEPHNAFSELSDFLEHMNIVHKESLGTNHALSLRRGFQRPSQGISGHCTLCGRQAKVLRSHLSRHLEQLALFAIPQTDYMADLEEEDAMSDVARQSFGASSDDECSSEHSAGTSIIADSGGGDDSGSPVTEKVSRGHEEEYEKQVPDLPEYLEEGVDTSWDIVTPKFQDARAAMYGSRSSGVDDVPSKFPVLTQAATSSQSPIGISQEKPLNPPPVPTLVLIPPDEHQTVGTSMVGPAQQPDTSPVRRLSLVKRASRFSDTILPSRNLLKNQDAPGSDESKIPQVPQASTGEHGDSTLHPFWRPRGFWDGFEDSDEEFQDDILPAGGDTSSEPEPKKEGWRNRLSSLVKKPGNFKESWAERRREKRRKELRKLINPQQL